MPVSFLFVLVCTACAIVSPLVGAGLIWALRAERWRHAGQRAALTGGIVAVKCTVTYLALHLLFGDEIPFQPAAVAVAGGAGFTIGALASSAWSGLKSRMP